MAQQNSGCTLILILLGLGLILVFWQFLLAALLLIGLVFVVMAVQASQYTAKLRSITSAAQQRFGGDVCSLGDHFALLERIWVGGNSGQPRLMIAITRVAHEGDEFVLLRDQRQFTPPADLRVIASNLAFSRFLEQQGVLMINDLSVEAKAAKAAMTCLQETEWARKSAAKMEGMIRSASETLSKARGNELLEPSIPQLREALSTFQLERQKLDRHREESIAMLRKLDDFLSVPATIRPILSFDLDDLFDPSRFQELEASFEEVVTLNDVFRDLSRQKLS